MNAQPTPVVDLSALLDLLLPLVEERLAERAPTPLVYDLGEAAALLKVKKYTLERWIRAGLIEATELDNRRKGLTPKQIETFLENRRVREATEKGASRLRKADRRTVELLATPVPPQRAVPRLPASKPGARKPRALPA